jgi:protoporphyrinogen oxidase
MNDIPFPPFSRSCNSPGSTVIIGAGPAGLTAAYLLSRDGGDVTVLERDANYVGGISRTATYRGFAFDIGGHRFFSKSREVEELWTELLGDDFLVRPRKSRIYYRGQLFDYPIRALDALRKLGPLEAARCVWSYVLVKLTPQPEPRTFEQWVTQQFGKRLFEIFFKTYTEKVWGMKCSEISADWAAQRIKGLSLARAIWHALKPQKHSSAGGVGGAGAASRDKIITTLLDSFRYPRRGPGMLWEAAARRVTEYGGRVLLGQGAAALRWDGAAREWSVTTRASDGGGSSSGSSRHFAASHVVTSMPLRELVHALSPPPSAEVMRAAAALRYRDFLVVALIVKDRQMFDDNWIYIHDPGVRVGRIQNFKSWSPEMVPEPGLNCYGLEYFCFEGDGLWNSPDADIIGLASEELVKLGLASADDIVDGTVVRQPKAYPVYDEGYQERVALIRAELEANYPTLHLVGRNGMHKYNNQDHAMMTAMLTARNIVAGERLFDVWRVNKDAEYHEQGEAGAEDGLIRAGAGDGSAAASGERLVPMPSR